MPNWQVVKLYVAIASYRDYFLQSTIDSLFTNAQFPELITVGCFIQVMDNDPLISTQIVTNTHNGKVKYKVVNAGKIFSITRCRNNALKWLTNEHDYVLQIDSHSRFEKNWDVSLIKEIQSLTDPMPILSCYPPAWYPQNGLDVYVNHSFTHWAKPTYNSEPSKSSFMGTYDLCPSLEDLPREGTMPAQSWHVSAAFLFAPAVYFLTIKHPNWISFWGEELFHSLVAYTHGWNVYAPYTRPVYILYPQDVSDTHVLNKVWKDFFQEWHSRHYTSTDHLIDSIIDRTTGPGYLGTSRDLDELYKYLGYDLGNLFEDWRRERKALH